MNNDHKRLKLFIRTYTTQAGETLYCLTSEGRFIVASFRSYDAAMVELVKRGL